MAALNIRFGCEMSIAVMAPTPVTCMIDVHSECAGQLAHPTSLTLAPASLAIDGRDAFGNGIRRFVVPAGETKLKLDGLIVVDDAPDERVATAEAEPVQLLPDAVLTYLNPSRYCDSDRLGAAAWQMFGSARRDTALIEAICDYTYRQIKFGYEFARSDRTAFDAFSERIGVCRDFAHLAIALCRALNIPARYVNGYMGDIGVPADPAPMDFNAWFEAYLSGRWYTFDARHNCRRIGRIAIAKGRDACDVPILQTFGPHVLSGFKVITEEVEKTAAASTRKRRALAA